LVFVGRFRSTSRGSPASQAELVIQTCSYPQAGHSMRAAIFGKRRNTLGSVSIAVETEQPALGHLDHYRQAFGFGPSWRIVTILKRPTPYGKV